jgi:hypothetical protein
MQHYRKKIELKNGYEQIYICSSNFDQDGYIIANKSFGVVFTSENKREDFFNINFPIKFKEDELELIDEETFNTVFEDFSMGKALDKGYYQDLKCSNKRLLKELNELKEKLKNESSNKRQLKESNKNESSEEIGLSIKLKTDTNNSQTLDVDWNLPEGAIDTLTDVLAYHSNCSSDENTQTRRTILKLYTDLRKIVETYQEKALHFELMPPKEEDTSDENINKSLNIFNKTLDKDQRKTTNHCIIDFLKISKNKGRESFDTCAELEISSNEEIRKLLSLMENSISTGLQEDLNFFEEDGVPYDFMIEQIYCNEFYDKSTSEYLKHIDLQEEVEANKELIEYVTYLTNKYNVGVDLKGKEIVSFSLLIPHWWGNKHFKLVAKSNPDIDDSEIRALSVLYDLSISSNDK